MQTPYTITFRNTPLVCIETDEEVFVAMRPVVLGMGLNWKTQYRKLLADRDRYLCGHMTTQLPGDTQSREHIFMPLRRFTGWLMSVSTAKVKPAIRETIQAYQRECDDVLFKHFYHELQQARHEAEMLLEGHFQRNPMWRGVFAGVCAGENRSEICRRTGWRAKSTVSRNVARMQAAGVFATWRDEV